ncbi:MAG: peptide MFS transporter [Acidobacteria bacterium]|nr:peptide MFS transporter [Acidobacteriota bacterium]
MATVNNDTAFFGHPRGLSTLFFTEMWERFSYYGLRAILLLYMVADPSTGGLGFSIAKASAIYSLYASMNYLLALPGGWLADKFLGLRNCVLLGGLLIAIGNGLMFFPGHVTFYFGLTGIVFGTGLLKTNASTMVGTLYRENDNRRDSGFSIYYMGINIGALVSPLVVGYLAQRVNWRYGFPVASLFMVIGIIQVYLGSKNFPDRVFKAVPPSDIFEQKSNQQWLKYGLATMVAIAAAIFLISPSAEGLADSFGAVLLTIVIAVLGFLLFKGSPNAYERRRLAVVCILFFISTLFWSSFEQAGSTLNLFAEQNTVDLFPSTWYQSFNSAFLIPLAPVFAALWIRMGDRQPSVPIKFTIALIFVGLGYVWLMFGAQMTTGGAKVSPLWLVGTYFLHTVGELCLSPVGLSAMTKLAPARMAGFIMGVFFMSIASGNYIGGRLASLYEKLPLPQLFGGIGAFCIIVALVFACFAKPVARMMESEK